MGFQRGTRIYHDREWGHSGYNLTMNLAAFCLCPENLREAELKSNGTNVFDGRNIKQERIQSVAWLLLPILVKVYSEKQ